MEQFLLFSTIFCNLIFISVLRTRFSLRDKRLFEITEVEITRVDCMYNYLLFCVLYIQSNFNGSNTFGTMEISSR